MDYACGYIISSLSASVGFIMNIRIKGVMRPMKTIVVGRCLEILTLTLDINASDAKLVVRKQRHK